MLTPEQIAAMTPAQIAELQNMMATDAKDREAEALNQAAADLRKFFDDCPFPETIVVLRLREIRKAEREAAREAQKAEGADLRMVAAPGVGPLAAE